MVAYAGVSVMDPLTPKQLLELGRERRKIEWDMTTAIQATIINYSMGKSGSPVRASQLHPIRKGVDFEGTAEEYAYFCALQDAGVL